MRLDSALELKEELLLQLPPMVARRDGVVPRIGIGLAPTPVADDYQMAVRPRFETDLTETALNYLRRRSRGELDIRVTGPIVPTGRLSVGTTVAHRRGRIGTLGFFARRTRDGALGFVSANHVIAAQDGGAEGDEVIQPAPP